jgi:cell division septum initiation protein DivIVA
VEEKEIEVFCQIISRLALQNAQLKTELKDYTTWCSAQRDEILELRRKLDGKNTTHSTGSATYSLTIE